jgi:hypothetical protein
MRDGYYDKQGRHITLDTWLAKIEDEDYKRVDRTILPNDKVVSTVWLGLDHSFGDGEPLIFETMVFPSENDFLEIDTKRYSTLADAVVGHEMLVIKYASKSTA